MSERAQAPEREPAQPRREVAPSGRAGGGSPTDRQSRPGLLALQGAAGNSAVSRLVAGQRPRPTPARPVPQRTGVAVQRLTVGPADVEEGAEPAGEAPAPEAAVPQSSTDVPDGGRDAGADDGGDAPQPPSGTALTPEAIDPGTAAMLADLAAAERGAAAGGGPANPLLTPPLLRAAAALLPDRAEDLGTVQRSAVPRTPAVQRTDLAVQRKGTVPTRKVKMTVPDWKPIPLFKEAKLGQWFLLSGEVESPTWEGTAAPPESIGDDTKEEELQLTADGKVSGYAVTLHKETLGKVGDAKIEGKLAVEATDKAVKVSGLTVELPNYGPEGVLLTGQVDFDLMEWKAGEPPDFMALSYTQKIGLEREVTHEGWVLTGVGYLPFKFTIKPNPLKVAEFVARVIAPKLMAAAPAALAIGAPLAAGAVCLALYADAIRAGKDFGVAIEHATANTKGYVTGYVGTIFDHPPGRWSNAGSAQGIADAQKVLDAQRWAELPEGARTEIRKHFDTNPGFLNVPAAQQAMWNRFRGEAIAAYREKNPFDTWMYDKGWGGNLYKLHKFMDIAGPPWSGSSY